MCFAHLVPSPNLQVFRYRDIDDFRQGLRDASVDIVPLAYVDGPFAQSILSLPGCDIYLLQTFPRIVHAVLEGNCAFVLLSMQDSLSAVFNGKEVGRPSLQYASGPAEYRAVEREAGYYAALTFSPAMGDRGWPKTDGEFQTVRISRDLELKLRELISQLFATASRSPDLVAAPRTGAALTESLLEALDLAFDGYLAVKSPRREATLQTLRALKMIDDLVDSNTLGPIYSADIASKLGVSVRTLTSLMVKTNDMSLQRYIRLRRLWSVRRQLLNGDPRQQIKQIALTNGFWHLGDFAARYCSQFGELPSSTQALALSRQ